MRDSSSATAESQGFADQRTKLNLYEESLRALDKSMPEEGRTPGPDKIIHALHALTLAMLSVAEETSRS